MSLLHLFQKAVDSSKPENGDSDSLKTSASLSVVKPGEVKTENVMDCGTTAGVTTPTLGAVSYTALLATGGILPTTANAKPTATILLPSAGML